MSFIDTTGRAGFSAEKMQKVNLFETPQMFCDLYCLEPGQAQKPHDHPGATKFYYVVEGSARFTVGGREQELGVGGLAWAGPGEEHGVRNDSAQRALLLVSMAPNPNSA